MLYLLNLINPEKPTFWLLVALGVLLLIEILVFSVAAIISRRRKPEERKLIGLELDTDIVDREFIVGDEFDCVGLLVKASYNLDPIAEDIVDYVVLSAEELEEAKSKGELVGCYVVKPNMEEAGKKAVTVMYQDKIALYTIAIYEAIEEEPAVEEVVAVVAEPEIVPEPIVVVEEPQPIIIAEESADNRLRYDKSFTARLIQSDDEVKQWYTELKNDLLSYKKVKARMSWKRETYKIGKEVVAKISFRGKTMCLYLPLNAADFAESKYHLDDVSDTPSNVDTPVMYRLKNARRVKYATELIAMAMDRFGLVRVERIAEDYYLPYEGIVELINKGLVKRKIKSAADEAVFLQNKNAASDSSKPQEIAPGMYVTATKE